MCQRHTHSVMPKKIAAVGGYFLWESELPRAASASLTMTAPRKPASLQQALFCAKAFHRFPWVRAAYRVFSISMARVMGPTPPGTGVMQEARSAAAA